MKASATIEMLYIMPVFFMVFIATVYTTFYYHDKAIISGAVHETAAVVSLLDRKGKGVDHADAEALFSQRVQGKLILFSGANVQTNVSKNEVVIEASANKRHMKVRAKGVCAITKPEEYIRNLRRIGKLGKED